MCHAHNLYVPGYQNLYQLERHQPPHFHATYGGSEVIVSIRELEVIEGEIPGKQLKMFLGWAAFHQEELMENWTLAENMQELFPIAPLR